MTIHILPADAQRSPADALCRQVATLGAEFPHADVGIDARGCAEPVSDCVDELCRRLPARVPLRLDWRPSLPPEWASAPPRGLILHVGAADLAEFLHWRGPVDRLVPPVVIDLQSGIRLPDIEWAFVDLTFAWPSAGEEPLALRRDLLTVLAADLGAAVVRLAARSRQVRIDGCLPSCVFAPDNLGRLAKECLPLGDFRRAADDLAWHADADALSLWRGRYRKLRWPRTTEIDKHIRNHALAREADDDGGDFLPQCPGCPLRANQACSAHIAHGPPRPALPQPAVWSGAKLASNNWRININRALGLQRTTDGGMLHFPSDRRLNALRLNEPAMAIWECLGNGVRSADFLVEVRRGWGAQYADFAAGLLETFQQAGMISIHKEEPLE